MDSMPMPLAVQPVGPVCPHCGRAVDCHDCTTDPSAEPRSGSVAICWHCRGLALFVSGPSGLSLRLPTEEEAEALAADSRIARTLAAATESYTPHQAADLARGPCDTKEASRG